MGNSVSRQAYEKPVSTVRDVALKNKSQDSALQLHQENFHEKNKEDIYLLKKMFCKLDPAVIKNSSDIAHGQLKLSLKYVSDQQLLLIKVFEARYLNATSVRGQAFNPFVKIEFVPNNTGETECEAILGLPENGTKFTNPIPQSSKLLFNEIFSFKLPQENFGDWKLCCSIWSSDGVDSNDFFGEIYLDIAQLDCVDEVYTAWYDLQPQTDITIGGNLLLRLSYKLPNSLLVTVNKAVGMMKAEATLGLSIRVYIPGVPYVFRTSPAQGSGERVWDEVFTFPLPKEELQSRYLVLVAVDSNEEDSYYGECHIDLENLDIHRGFEGSFSLSDMRGSNVVRSRWSKNAVTQELQEALYAHSVYMRPQFLFDRDAPRTKALSVGVPKAFVHSQIRVANGVVVQ